MYFSADYFTGKGITQAVLFTLEAGLGGAGFGEYIALIAVSTLCFILVVAASYLYLRFIKHREHPKPKRIKGIVHNTFLLFAFLIHPFNLDLYSIYTSMNIKQSKDFDQYYKKPNLTYNKKPIHQYNLVYIYAESLERTYFDEMIFPGLMKNLKELRKESIEFTNINQVVATGWTIGGMTATQCAIPLFTASGGNSMNGTDSFLSGASCLGDVLKSKGYHLAFIQGSSVDFSGIRKLYTTHKFDEIYGFDELQEVVKNKSYRNGWGLYDDTLLLLVYKKFEELSKTDKPFALFTATIDTHHPKGMTSKLCSDIPYKKGDNSILNAVHCSDRLIARFIKKIQNSKYANKTIIVLTSDHLALRNTATKQLTKNDSANFWVLLKKKTKRRDLFLIFDPATKQYTSINKEGSMLDVGPTVLNKLSIKTDLGLGRNLLQAQSLISKFNNFNKKLLSWRKSILKLWQFASLGEGYNINTTSKEVNIQKHTYKVPVLIKIEEDRSIIPLFEFDSPEKLDEYLAKFEPEQKFIWIDSCSKINRVFDLNLTGKLCVSQGSLAADKLESKTLNNEKNIINTTQLFKNTEVNGAQYRKRISNLQKLLDCKHPPKGKISIVSSRMPVLTSIPSAIRTSNQSFPLSRGLNILTIDYNGEYSVKQFDVYGSQDAANDFIKTIADLIKKKRFWAVMAHDAINNTHPGYKEKLTTLGFKILPTLNFRVAYIAYQDEDGVMHEFSDKDTLCKIIPSFIKPLSEEELHTIEIEKEKRYGKAKQYSHDTSRFIAHAGGMIDGITYTDSLEALNENYKKGFRLFELDIIETSDHIFVASHDWKGWKNSTGYTGSLPPSRKVFKQYKIKGKYTPVDISDINNWFKEHPDAILVTDKINSPMKFSQKFIDKNRLMMELFTWEAVEEGVSAGILSVMPTGSLLNTADALKKLDKLKIKDIAISRRMIHTHKNLLKKITEKGIHMYAFHVNHDKGKDEKYVLCEESEYFFGMYADKWNFDIDLDCNMK
jgi:phosphoglycerol transferase